MKTIFIFISLMLLQSCSNTGAIKIGKDTYLITARVPFSGEAGAKADALKEANIFCQQTGKELLFKENKSRECALQGGCGEAEITFMCLNKNDPRYTEVNMHKNNTNNN